MTVIDDYSEKVKIFRTFLYDVKKIVLRCFEESGRVIFIREAANSEQDYSWQGDSWRDDSWVSEIF